jgi:hypothetical protein
MFLNLVWTVQLAPFHIVYSGINLIQPKTFNNYCIECQSLFRYPKHELVIDRLLA